VIWSNFDIGSHLCDEEMPEIPVAQTQEGCRESRPTGAVFALHQLDVYQVAADSVVSGVHVPVRP